MNDEIRISPIRLVDDAGEQVGIVSLEDARERARESGLDLVEVAPEARPPVVRLMDHGKWRYEQAKSAQEARRHQHQTQIKEVKFRPGIAEHDYEFKARHVRRFLESGNKVKLTMQFRGRQMSHPEIGQEILERLVGELAEVAVPESVPTLEGRFMTLMLAPRRSGVKKKSF
ncbi:MAG: translation initiation factor IF-3 [Longimicrobiales bacterium]